MDIESAKKSNMSNKIGFPSDNVPPWKPPLGFYRPQGQPHGGGLLIHPALFVLTPFHLF
jgi:hypothetical protein